MSKLWKPDNAGKILPVVYVRPLLPPPPSVGARLQPQHMHWQLGRYKEDLTFGPGGRGRRKRWVVDQEAEQHNLVLNQTYDTLMAQYGFLLGLWAAVGTGSTLPDATQTSLVAEAARTNVNESGGTNTWSISRVADGVADITVVREFTEAQVGNKNLAEWGFAPAQTPSSNLMSRELFRDGSGNPVVITPASDQRLRLIYRWRVSVGPVTAQSVSININGIGVRTGKLFLRKYVVGNVSPWSTYGEYFGDIAALHVLMTGDLLYHVLHSADVPPDYNNTSSYSSGGNSKVASYNSYTSGSRTRTTQPVTWLPSEANMTIRLIGLGYNSIYPMGVKLDSGQEFTKTNLYKLTIGEWTVTWGP